MHKIRTTHLATTLLSLIILIAHTSAMRAQGTAFTYQGSMSDNGSPASGIYDLRFALYTVETNGVAIDVVTNVATTIADGLFTVTLDFGGGVFDGGDRWLEIGAVTNGGGWVQHIVPTATHYRHPICGAGVKPQQ